MVRICCCKDQDRTKADERDVSDTILFFSFVSLVYCYHVPILHKYHIPIGFKESIIGDFKLQENELQV